MSRASGSAASTRATTHSARELDADMPVWERQQGESAKAYAAFVAYRDSPDRRVRDHGGSAFRWSSEWSWGYRAFEWDKHLALADSQDLLRLRREMNRRHRAAAQLAQNRVVQWLQQADPARMTASDAARWFEVAVRVERLANGGDLPLDLEPPEAPEQPTSLASFLDLPTDIEAELARLIHLGTTREPAVDEPETGCPGLAPDREQ